MGKQVQHRRGTTIQHNTFTGADGEVTVDTDKHTLVIHDGTTVGGFPLVTQVNVPLKVVDSIALQLKSLPVTTEYNVFANYYNTPGDGGEGYFRPATTGGPYTNNDGTIIVPGGGTASSAWIRLFSGDVNVRWFGATGDGVTDDSPAMRKAIAYCQLTYLTLFFPNGTYAINTTINLTGKQIIMLGANEGLWQAGSVFAAPTFTWTGGAAPMFSFTNTSRWAFIGFNVRSNGSATDFIYMGTGTQAFRLKRMSFVPSPTYGRFTRSIIYSDGNRLGYSEFSEMYFLGAAPKFIYINGGLTANGITPFSIKGRSVFESAVYQPTADPLATHSTVVYVESENIDQLSITGCTFNAQGYQLTIVDTTLGQVPFAPTNPVIRSLTFSENEIDADYIGPEPANPTHPDTATFRAMRLLQVSNVIINGNQVQAGGVPTALVNLVRSNIVSFTGNDITSLNGPVFEADNASYVNIGMNFITEGNTKGIINTTSQGIVDVAWTAGGTSTITANLSAANKHSVFRISPTSNAAWTWSTAIDTGSVGYATYGQIITVMIKNASGGTILAGTPSATYFKTSGAPVAPANGFSRSYTFVWDGTYWVELYRSAADVAN